MEALAIGSAPPRPCFPPPTRYSHLRRPKTLATSAPPRRLIAAAPMDGTTGRSPAPLRSNPAETDAVATSSHGTEAETAATDEATEQGNGIPVPDAVDAPAANIEGVDGIKIRRRPVTGPSVHYVGPFQFRLENEGNTPRNILEKIVWNKDVEVWQMKERRPLYMLKGPLDNAPPARDFVGALKASYDRTGVPALIAEVKKASPSRGVLREDFDPGVSRLRTSIFGRKIKKSTKTKLITAKKKKPSRSTSTVKNKSRLSFVNLPVVKIAQAYEENGAACLSVLTDAKYFQGSFDYLESIRNAGVKCPLLCKEFIIDAWQLYYARSKGADAVLLIAAILPDRDIKYMLKICKILGMAALVEVHDEREINRVLGIDGIQLIGINNRNLETFEVDISNTKKLLEGERGEIVAQKDIIVVGESGLFMPDHVSFVQDAGVKAVLVGESLIKMEDPGKAIAGLFGKDISHASAV